MTDQRRDASPTLADLAALAAKKVEGFKRPTIECEDQTWIFDDSPAALAMAVWVYIGKKDGSVNVDGLTYTFLDALGVCETAADPSEESIARALLAGLLGAHGVEVPE